MRPEHVWRWLHLQASWLETPLWYGDIAVDRLRAWLNRRRWRAERRRHGR